RGCRPVSSSMSRTAASARVPSTVARPRRFRSAPRCRSRVPTTSAAGSDFDSKVPRQALGIVRPVISPDATKVAFAALGDIYLMPVGGRPDNLTKDRALDTDPAWSPDGSQLVYSSDKGGGFLQLWIHDLRSGQDRQLTR